MSIIDLILFGAVVGAIANIADPVSKKGFLGPIFLGGLGAVIGGTLAKLIFNVSSIGAGNLVILGVSALIVLTLVGLSKVLKVRQENPKLNLH